MSYHFDRISITKANDYRSNFIGRHIVLTNSKDSTYNLSIRNSNQWKDATITDRKNKYLINFAADFDYKELSDINKLSKATYFSGVVFSKQKRFKKYVEEFAFETDTVTNKTIVHLKQYKNKKKRKVINEHYYYFGKDHNLKIDLPNSTKSYLLRKYNVQLAPKDNVEKILCLTDGKISSDNVIELIDEIDFTYNFTAELKN